MANYESVTRSNYFHVKDEDAFSKFMDTVSGDDMHCWSDKDIKLTKQENNKKTDIISLFILISDIYWKNQRLSYR